VSRISSSCPQKRSATQTSPPTTTIRSNVAVKRWKSIDGIRSKRMRPPAGLWTRCPPLHSCLRELLATGYVVPSHRTRRRIQEKFHMLPGQGVACVTIPRCLSGLLVFVLRLVGILLSLAAYVPSPGNTLGDAGCQPNSNLRLGAGSAPTTRFGKKKI